MKKLVKIIGITFIILILTMCFQAQTNTIYAKNIINTNDYNPESNSVNYGSLTTKANVIATVIRNVGIVVSVIALMIIGLRAMVGSAEEKADYKKALPGYIFGAIMVGAISAIPSIIQSVTSKW